MELKVLCKNCNDFLKEFNDNYSLDAFKPTFYKTQDCLKDYVDFNGEKVSCVTMYGTAIKYYSCSEKFFYKLSPDKEPEKLLDEYVLIPVKEINKNDYGI